MVSDLLFRDLGTAIGTIAGTLVVGFMLIFRAWTRLKLDRQIGTSEGGALRTLESAADNWKALYDTAWSQVARERGLREVAELRATEAVRELEEQRAQVAVLRREVDRLTRVSRRSLKPKTPPSGEAS